MPPPEVLFAAKDYGKVYFVAPPSIVENFLKAHTRQFALEKNFALLELEVSPGFKRELRRRTPQGQLDEKKSAVIQVIMKLPEVMKKFNAVPWQMKNACLDEYIAEIARAEKILAEIFPELHSNTIKLNLNMFKEFLMDIRLYNDPQLKMRAIDDFNRHVNILVQDLNHL